MNSITATLFGFVFSVVVSLNSYNATVLSPRMINDCNANEESEIKEAVLGYISNFFLNDYEAMEIHLHDRLSKRGVNADGSLSAEYPKEALKELMTKKPVLPIEHQKNEIIEVNIHTNVATVILETGYPNTRWKEYIHLAKIDNKWIVMDVFWDFETKN